MTVPGHQPGADSGGPLINTAPRNGGSSRTTMPPSCSDYFHASKPSVVRGGTARQVNRSGSCSFSPETGTVWAAGRPGRPPIGTCGLKGSPGTSTVILVTSNTHGACFPRSRGGLRQDAVDVSRTKCIYACANTTRASSVGPKSHGLESVWMRLSKTRRITRLVVSISVTLFHVLIAVRRVWVRQTTNPIATMNTAPSSPAQHCRSEAPRFGCIGQLTYPLG